MRPDIHKVICERERRGSRDYNPGKDYDSRFRVSREHREDREEEYHELENLPKYESMQARFGYDDSRAFSDRLGAIKGLIRKSEGKNWDKIYSELCRHVSPTGTVVQQHVHQHLESYICRETRIGPDGDVECLGTWDNWVAPHQIWPDYYVHPKTRCVTKVKGRPKNRRRGSRQEREAAERHARFRYSENPLVQYHKINGMWFLIQLAPVTYEFKTVPGLVPWITVERWCEVDRAKRIQGSGANVAPVLGLSPTNEFGGRREYKVVGKKALSHQQLKYCKLSNDPAK